MNILLVYPEYPDTFWSFKHALKFVSKKAANPPLGLLTVASLLPSDWNKKLTDLNTEKLKMKDIIWADMIFISAMSVQYNSAKEIIQLCKSMGKVIVAGGPLFTEDYERFDDIDYLVLNEGEITIPRFLADLEKGSPKHIYETGEFAEMKESPAPDYSLIKLSKYSSVSIQYSRGCPFNCEFCDITALFGHRVRTKSTEQILQELEGVYNLGWRGDIFIVDDNFIGKKVELKKLILPGIINWMKSHNNPFTFSTQASVNLADDPELMNMMTEAGFSTVFVGIETPEDSALEECRKVQNRNRDLVTSVKTIQNNGMEVLGGFIVGFDSDSPNIFRQQVNFIMESGIVSAMIGLLNAPAKSQLYQRLKKEGRILNKMSGDNTDSTMNFIPKMNKDTLISGYHQLIRGIYEGKPFYQRVRAFLNDFNPKVKNRTKVNYTKIKALIKSMFIIGILDESRRYYWSLFFWSLFKKPRLFPLAITYSIYGYHYRRVFRKMNCFD